MFLQNRYPPFKSEVSFAKIAEEAPFFAKAVKGRKSVRDGHLYQQGVSRLFETLYGFQYVADLWFQYSFGEPGELKWCSPDGLFFDVKRGHIHIIEVKRSHTSVAFAQLRNKYLPILRAAFRVMAEGAVRETEGGECIGVSASPPLWKFFLTEVAPAFDPLDAGGEKVKIIRTFGEAQSESAGVNFLPVKRQNWRKK